MYASYFINTYFITHRNENAKGNEKRNGLKRRLARLIEKMIDPNAIVIVGVSVRGRGRERRRERGNVKEIGIVVAEIKKENEEAAM